MFRLKTSVPATVVLAVFALLSATVTDAKFPNNPKPCAYGDDGCIKSIINFLLSEKVDGYGSLNVVALNPLKISEINIKQGKESPVNIDLEFRKSELFGIKDAKAEKVKGFGKDLAGPHELTLSTDSVSLLGDYTISGRVLILPISGTGKSNITLDNVKLKLLIQGEPIVKNDETYMGIKDLKLIVDTTRMHFDFTNLFNGDKALGDNMNLFLNENWSDIFGEVRGSITSAFAAIFKSVIANVFQKYPYSKFFAAE